MSLKSAFVFAALLVASGRAWAIPIDWNDSAIEWKSLDDGLAAAAKAKKPVCLVIYAEWCPHCHNFSSVFHDKKVIDTAKHFVMIHVDADKNKSVDYRFAVDGAYVPRTFFLDPAGKIRTDVHAPRNPYAYFYDEREPSSVLQGMQAALKKAKD